LQLVTQEGRFSDTSFAKAGPSFAATNPMIMTRDSQVLSLGQSTTSLNVQVLNDNLDFAVIGVVGGLYPLVFALCISPLSASIHPVFNNT